MIIVEGPDGGGKTSLIGMLAERLSFEVMPRACTSDNGVDPGTLAEWVDRDLSLPVHHRGFYDRHPLVSEPIYGPIIRGHMADGFSDVQWLSRSLATLRARDPFFIFCLPPVQNVLDNIALGHGHDTKHLRGVHTHGRALYEMYCMRAAQEASHPYSSVWLWNYMEASEAQFEELVQTTKGHI
jgi:hypothetical protein